MSVKTPVGRRIDEIIRHVFESYLRPRGFRKAGRKIWRPSDGVFQRLDFQATSWGTTTDGSFCVNLVVADPNVYEAVMDSPPPVSAHLCYPMLQERLHDPTADESDHWFGVRPDSAVASIAGDVTRLLELQGMPWLDEHGGRDRLLRKFAVGEFPPALLGGRLAHAILLSEIGKSTQAVRVVNHIKALDESNEYLETIALVEQWVRVRNAREDGPARP